VKAMKTEIKNLTRHLGEYILLPFILLVVTLAVCGLAYNMIIENYAWILLALIFFAPFLYILLRMFLDGIEETLSNIRSKLFLLNYFLIFVILLISVEAFQVGSVIVVLFILGNLVYYFKKVKT